MDVLIDMYFVALFVLAGCTPPVFEAVDPLRLRLLDAPFVVLFLHPIDTTNKKNIFNNSIKTTTTKEIIITS